MRLHPLEASIGDESAPGLAPPHTRRTVPFLFASVVLLVSLTASATPDPYYDEAGQPLGPITKAAAAANPKLMFGRASIIGIDNDISVFGVPISNSSGKIVLYDLVISFTPNSNGAPPKKAAVTAVRSPLVSSRAVVAGSYDARPSDATCTVTNLALASGRTQTQLKCDADGEQVQNVELSVVTGAVDSSHPYFPSLKEAAVDKRPDVGNYFWGQVTVGSGKISGCSIQNGRTANGTVVGAQQSGNQILLTFLATNGNFVCMPTLTRTP